MQRSFVFVVLVASGFFLLGPRQARAHSGSRPPFFAAEARALQSHFDSVDVELRNASESRLSMQQRKRRHELIHWLKSYRDAGEFPHNDGVAVQPIPIFRDDRDVLCAMAYLISRSGHVDIVNRVAATRNFAYIAELTDDASLVAWLDEQGLTIAEAARIQPTYSPPPSTDEGKIETKFLWVSVALMGVDATASYFSVTAPSNRSVVVGLIGGVGALAVGSSHLGDVGTSRTLARATTIVGAVATVVGFWRAATPGNWYRAGPVGRATALVEHARVVPMALPTGNVATGLGWTISFR